MGYSESCKYPAESRQITYGGEQYEWDDFRKALNDKLIELDVHEDKLIGPYFLTVAQLRSPQDVLQKLFLYLWDDVLRFRQHELFTAKSFSQVMIDWAHGTGSTLSMTMPRSIAQSILASLVGVGSAKEVLPVAAGSDPTSTDGLPPA